MSQRKKTVIYGGGLAGLSLGIALRQRNVPVVLHEAGTYPRHRVCGEFIAGADQSLFRKLGIASALSDALILDSTIWHCGTKQVLNKRLPSPVTSISRHTLDERLSKQFEENGGVLHCGSRGKEDSVKQEGFIWATGRKPATQDTRGKGWIGLKCHIVGLKLKSDLEFFIGRNGYLGISPVSKDRFNICGLFRLNRQLTGTKQELFNKYLKNNGLQHLVPRLEAAQIDHESWCAVAGLDYSNGKTLTKEFQVGDQLGLIAPLTGNGMSIAFESAAIAAPFIESWAHNNLSWSDALNAAHRAQTKAFAKRKRVGRLLQRFLLNPYGQTLFRLFSKTHAVPFNTLYSLTHNV